MDRSRRGDLNECVSEYVDETSVNHGVCRENCNILKKISRGLTKKIDNPEGKRGEGSDLGNKCNFR